MKVILLGATGMIGQGALRELLLDPDVERVLLLGRSATGTRHDKVRELVHPDLFDLRAVEAELAGYDVCLLCLGTSAAGMSEPEYRRVTYDLTLSVARTLARLSPAMTFLYISGQGTGGAGMWARVKLETEQALLALPFKAAYMLRPGAIRPLHGITSRTRLYRTIYAGLGWLFPLLGRVAPNLVTTTEKLGRALINVARDGYEKKILEMVDINAMAMAKAGSPPAA